MNVKIKKLGRCEYTSVVDSMLQFTQQRNEGTPDEIWLLDHYPVYTQGTSCSEKPKPQGSQIPLIRANRGGQITYHGPGQLTAYFLFDIKRRNTGPRSFVNYLEQLIIDFLDGQGVAAQRMRGAPGVYVNAKKIAALGLRISRGYSYHGLSLNVDMDLEPFHWINPCGYPDLEVTQLKDHIITINYQQVIEDFKCCLLD